MPQSSIPGYVARYGDALRRLTGAPVGNYGAFSSTVAQRVNDPSLSPNTSGLAQEAATGIDGAFGAPMQPAGALPQVAPAAAQVGALANPTAAKTGAPTAAAKGGGRSFWDIAKELSDPEKEQITKQFEDKGVDVPTEFNRMADAGQVDMGLVKRGKDGKIDKRDMGLFLLENGLRTMQAASKEGATGLGSMATGALDTMEARRGRAAQATATAEEQRRYGEARSDKKAERAQDTADKREVIASNEQLAATRETGDNKRAAAQIEAQGKIAAMEAVSRKEAAQMSTGANKRTFVDESDGMVYWVDSGEPVMVKGKDGPKPLKGKTQVDRGAVTDKDLLTATEKHRAALDENLVAQVTIPGEAEPVRWSKATDEQKNAYLSAYKRNLQSQAGEQTPEGTGANPFDQFDP